MLGLTSIARRGRVAADEPEAGGSCASRSPNELAPSRCGGATRRASMRVPRFRRRDGTPRSSRRAEAASRCGERSRAGRGARSDFGPARGSDNVPATLRVHRSRSSKDEAESDINQGQRAQRSVCGQHRAQRRQAPRFESLREYTADDGVPPASTGGNRAGRKAIVADVPSGTQPNSHRARQTCVWIGQERVEDVHEARTAMDAAK